jgi:hypothetical protein
VGASGKPLTPLQQAVKDVHRVFRRVPKPTELKHSEHFGWGRETRFLDRDRSELTAYDLYGYIEDSYYPDVRELGYFIPRICEIMANGESMHMSIGWVCSLNCLQDSDFPSAWPDDQAQAIQRFVEALLVAYVNEPVRFSEIDHSDLGESIGELLCMAGRGGIDVDGVTTALAQADKQSLARALALWIKRECYNGRTDKWCKPELWREGLSDAFWEGKDFQKPVFDWLVSLEPWHMFSAAAERETHPVWQRVLSKAAGYCDLWPERPRRIPRD